MILVGGCSSTYTEIVVVVDADPSVFVPTTVDNIAIELTPAAAGMTPSFRTTSGQLTDFPVTFGIKSRDGAASTVSITVTGLRGESIVMRRTVRTQFVVNERRYVVVRLEAACNGVTCADCAEGEDPATCGQTCVAGTCTPIAIEPATPIPAEWQIEAGIIDFDAGVRDDAWALDTGSDVGTDAFVPPDAWPQSCEDPTPNLGIQDQRTNVPIRGVPGRPYCVTPGAYPDGGLIVQPETQEGDPVLRFALHQPLMNHNAQENDRLAFDLDGYASDGISNRTGECLYNTMPTVADGPEGIDNVVGRRVFPRFAMSTQLIGLPDPDNVVATRVNGGALAPILMIRGWNGLPYDTAVTAGLSFAVDVAPSSYTGGPPTDVGSIADAPRWDGTDRAYFQCSSLERCSIGMADVNRPVAIDDTAYVANGYLVMELIAGTALTLPVGSGPDYASLQIIGGRLIAHLSPEGQIDEPVRIVGRTQKMLYFSFLSSFGFCPGITNYSSVYSALDMDLDQNQDLLTRPNRPPVDVQPPDSACRAVSLMVLYRAAAAVQTGDIISVNAVRAACGDAGVADAGSPDSGPRDAGPGDAGPRDAGMASIDADTADQ